MTLAARCPKLGPNLNIRSGVHSHIHSRFCVSDTPILALDMFLDDALGRVAPAQVRHTPSSPQGFTLGSRT